MQTIFYYNERERTKLLQEGVFFFIRSAHEWATILCYKFDKSGPMF
jgi:hypothetical protein